MRTPSLRSRVVFAGVAVVGVLLLGLNLFVWWSLRDRLNESLDQLVDARAQLAGELGRAVEPEVLQDRLTELGIPALVDPASGPTLRAAPATTRFEGGPPGEADGTPGPWVSRLVDLPDGGTVRVFATRAGVDATLERVVVLESIGSAVAIALALGLLWRGSEVVTRPLDHVVRTARRIAAGRTRERLDPDRPDTELGRLAVAFNEMLDALEAALEDARASEARSREFLRESREAESRSRRFLADAAHQLRTPVTGMRTTVEALLREQDEARRERLLDVLAGETARTGRLLSQLLRVAQLDRGLEPARRPVDLLELIDAEVQRTAELAPHLDVRLEADADVVPVEIEVHTVAEAVSNLLDNARRYAASSIRVGVETEAGGVAVMIADDGPGLPSDQHERAFERFVTLDDTGGSGLGLPIARGIARAHEGDVTYEERGFVLRLPLSPTRPRAEVPS